jgi:ELWxxDGT repeat protein
MWRTDGTPGGTSFFKDLVNGPTDSNTPNNYHLFSNGSYLLFTVNSGGLGSELWTSDGTNATPLMDINPGAPSSIPDFFYVLNGLVIFQATDATHGREYWKTNGTIAGTSILKDINPGPGNVNSAFTIPFSFAFKGKAFFIANDGTHGDEIWFTNGTEDSTLLLKDIQSGAFASTSILNAVRIDNKFFFTSTDIFSRFEMWTSDGTSAGTQLFKSFSPADFSGSPYIFAPYLFDFSSGTVGQSLFQGNKFFFTAGTVDEGNELWVSDGTIGGTKMVKNIGPGSNNGVNFSSYTYTSSFFYFAANDGTHGLELWKSDGTEPNTNIVADINPNAENSNPVLPFFINNGKLFITATDGVGAGVLDLYVLDGVLPLPVNLLNFTVTEKSADALVQWSTSREINSRDFILQRSIDGIHFTIIGTVSAVGTSSATNSYSFTDAGILNIGHSKVYYRLNQRNRDGSELSSSIISLNLQANNQITVRVLQNPVKSILPVLVSGLKDKIQFSIKDFTGKTLYTSMAAKINGYTSIPVNQLPNGTFILVVESSKERKAFTFIKQ